MKEILRTRGLCTQVDDEDCDRLSQYKWCTVKPHNISYATRKGRGKKGSTIRMHREILGVLPGIMVDHINGNGLDNRKCNLRICTDSQNQGNMRSVFKGKTSDFKGVSWKVDRNAWVAQIQYQKKKIHLGYYGSELDAAYAYNRFARKYFGSFACPNKIEKQNKALPDLVG